MDGKFDLDRARRDAKALLRAARAGDADALARLRPDRAPCLADAQRAVARDLGLSSWPALLRAVDAQGASPLLSAAVAGDGRAVYALLVGGADPNVRSPVTGRTALHEAAARGGLDVVSTLVTWVPVDVRARDRRGLNALEACLVGSGGSPDESAVVGYLAVAKVLVSDGLNARRDILAGAAPMVRDWVEARMSTEHTQPIVDLGRDGIACEMDVAWCTAIARSGVAEMRPVGDGLAFRTGSYDNTRNGVLCNWLDPRTIEHEIADVLSWFDDWHVPARWLVDGSAASVVVSDHLERLGCDAERTAVYMSQSLDDLVGEAVGRVPAAVEIVAVRSPAELTDAFRVLDTFDGDTAHSDLAVRLFGSLGLGADDPVRHWIAVGRAGCVGLASVHVHGRTAELVDLGVGASERRRGIGRALTLHAFAQARAAGCTTGILAPTAATVPFYDALGLELRPVPPDRSFYLPMG